VRFLLSRPECHNDMKLSEAIEGYWLDKKLDMSPTTIPGYEKTFARLVRFLDDAPFDAVTSDDIRRFLAWLPTEYPMGRRTVHDSWVPLSSLWTWAEKELGTPHIIRGRIRAPRYTERAISPLSAEQVRRIAAAAGNNRDRAIVLALADTGMRASELCGLKNGDYADGRMHIRHGKGDKARFVVAGVRTQKAIWRYLTERGETQLEDPLFATQTGRPMRRDHLRSILAGLGREAQVENVHPHRFRHTFAITYLRNGGNVLELKELLGHSSLVMVMRYARLAEQDIEASRRHSPIDNWRI
jgi:integrase/recombinase XerD